MEEEEEEGEEEEEEEVRKEINKKQKQMIKVSRRRKKITNNNNNHKEKKRKKNLNHMKEKKRKTENKSKLTCSSRRRGRRRRRRRIALCRCNSRTSIVFHVFNHPHINGNCLKGEGLQNVHLSSFYIQTEEVDGGDVEGEEEGEGREALYSLEGLVARPLTSCYRIL